MGRSKLTQGCQRRFPCLVCSTIVTSDDFASTRPQSRWVDFKSDVVICIHDNNHNEKNREFPFLTVLSSGQIAYIDIQDTC